MQSLPRLIFDALTLLRDPDCRPHLLAKTFSLPPLSPLAAAAVIIGDRCDTTLDTSQQSNGLFDTETHSSWLAIPTCSSDALHLGYVLQELQRTTEPTLTSKRPRFDKGRFAAKRSRSLVLIDRPDVGAVELLCFAQLKPTLTVHTVLRAQSAAFRAALARSPADKLDVPAIVETLTFFTSFLHKRFCESCYAPLGAPCTCPPPPPAPAPRDDFSRFRFALFPFTGAFTALGHVALHASNGRMRISGPLVSRVSVTENAAGRARMLAVAAHLFGCPALLPPSVITSPPPPPVIASPPPAPPPPFSAPPPVAPPPVSRASPFRASAASPHTHGLSLTDVAAVDGALALQPLLPPQMSADARSVASGGEIGGQGSDGMGENGECEDGVSSERRAELAKREEKKRRRIQKNREAAARSNLKRKKYREQLVSDLALTKRRAQDLRTIEVRLRKENRELRLMLSSRGTLAKAGMPIFSL